MAYSIGISTQVSDFYIFSLEIQIFHPPSLLFVKFAWPESIALAETLYTVGGQQQPRNILQSLNKTWRK